MNPSLLIQFDIETWMPTVFLNGKNDDETAKLKDLASKMLAAIEVSNE